MKDDEGDKRFDDFNDKYGIYIVIFILFLLIYGLKLKDDKPKHNLTNEELLNILTQPESNAFQYGYEIGYEAGQWGGEPLCYEYSGDVYGGCIAGYQSALDDKSDDR